MTGKQFLTGAQFLPENLRIVHHAIFFRMTAALVRTAEALDAQSPEPGWTCFGDAGVRDAEWVAHWAPGTNETLLDPKYGYPIPAGTKLVMQVHYNTLAQQTPGSDRSGIRLRVSDQALTPLATDLFASHVELPCTEKESGPLCDRQKAVEDIGRRFGEASMSQVEYLTQQCGPPTPGPTQHCDFPVHSSAVIHAMTGHMHLLGRSIKVELNPGTSAAQTLLDVPDYDFDDQSLRLLPTPVTVERGDTIRVTCTHDATLRSQLPQLKNLPARYVVWGEGTSDEMCLGVAITSPPAT
ncbi:monooxygenase [Acrocarpospora catenulata]|uniref:monooxygenase n=1 Tax=Acrocarpospora catenulata TaxID=2836182 RepID=UPI002023A3B6|nr:monooxygenase [Acrocarpospora catenulata]